MGKEDPTGWKVGTMSKDWAVYSSKIVSNYSTIPQPRIRESWPLQCFKMETVRSFALLLA